MTQAYPPAELAAVLKPWLATFPEKVLFGSDASALGPDLGWEVSAAVARPTVGPRSASRCRT